VIAADVLDSEQIRHTSPLVFITGILFWKSPSYPEPGKAVLI